MEGDTEGLDLGEYAATKATVEKGKHALQREVNAILKERGGFRL